MRHMGRGARVAALLVAGGLVGYLIGPPIANAAASLVTIQGGGTTNKAKVSSTGRLLIDTEAGQLGKFLETFSLTAPYGELVLVSGSGSTASKTGGGDITGVALDVTTSSTPITMTVSKGSGQVIWQGTVPTGPGNLA